MLTARAENHLYAAGDLDDTIARLVAYRDAGADVVYAPGLTELGEIRRVVESVGVPVNVLALRAGPSIGELADAGVRRVSTGSGLARAAYGAFVAAAEELRASGTSEYAAQNLPSDRSDAMFEFLKPFDVRAVGGENKRDEGRRRRTAPTREPETEVTRVVEEGVAPPPGPPLEPAPDRELWPWLLLLLVLVIGGIVAAVVLTRDDNKN